jgi:hypothetical protein
MEEFIFKQRYNHSERVHSWGNNFLFDLHLISAGYCAERSIINLTIFVVANCMYVL